MQPLPGNIELSSNPFDIMVWNKLKAILKTHDGVLGYKIPALGNKFIDDIPSIVLRSINFGVVVFDVVADKVVDLDENGDYWIKENNEDFRSRDFLLSVFCTPTHRLYHWPPKLRADAPGDFVNTQRF